MKRRVLVTEDNILSQVLPSDSRVFMGNSHELTTLLPSTIRIRPQYLTNVIAVPGVRTLETSAIMSRMTRPLRLDRVATPFEPPTDSPLP